MPIPYTPPPTNLHSTPFTAPHPTFTPPPFELIRFLYSNWFTLWSSLSGVAAKIRIDRIDHCIAQKNLSQEANKYKKYNSFTAEILQHLANIFFHDSTYYRGNFATLSGNSATLSGNSSTIAEIPRLKMLKIKNKCQYELLTSWDYVSYSDRVAMVEVNGASDPGSIPWSDFYKVIYLM